jgi:hypothetical protein
MDELLKDQQAMLGVPIENWSYSSLRALLRNPLAWKKHYVLKIYDAPMSPSGIVGRACHAALASYYRGNPADIAIEEGFTLIKDISDKEINYGKTGSREKILKDFSKTINGYLEEAPKKYHGIKNIEQPIIAPVIDPDGNEFPIPIKFVPDIVYTERDGLVIKDHKTVGSYTDPEKDKTTFILQAMCGYYAVLHEYGEAPKRAIFDEYKTSKNSDGTPQLRPYDIEYEQHPEYFALFFKILRDCTLFVAREDVVYLPNPDDLYDGEDSMVSYAADLIDAFRPTEVAHNTRQKEYAEKKFVPSKAGGELAKRYSPEERIRVKLSEFGLPVEMGETVVGANIIRYTCKPSRGRRMSEFEKVGKDLMLALKATSIRIEAPIPGTDTIGIEVPNPKRKVVKLADYSNEQLGLEPGSLTIPLGVNINGEVVAKDLAKMPHLLVAGATGSGKSVMLNVIIQSLLRQHEPATLGLVLIDPKRVEFSPYNGTPHLLAPVISDEKKMRATLKWLVQEMEARYENLESTHSRNIKAYNESQAEKMQYIVVVIDEFADLILGSMLSSKNEKHKVSVKRAAERETAKVRARQAAKQNEFSGTLNLTNPGQEEEELLLTFEEHTVEGMVVLLAQKARAVGIHIILGTQRPSVDVVTGIIKANIPTRIAFMTSSSIDSKVILDRGGAEELTGAGDMLVLDPSQRGGLTRLQGFFVE